MRLLFSQAFGGNGAFGLRLGGLRWQPPAYSSGCPCFGNLLAQSTFTIRCVTHTDNSNNANAPTLCRPSLGTSVGRSLEPNQTQVNGRAPTFVHFGCNFEPGFGEGKKTSFCLGHMGQLPPIFFVSTYLLELPLGPCKGSWRIRPN